MVWLEKGIQKGSGRNTDKKINKYRQAMFAANE